MVLHFLILLLELGWRELAIFKSSICQKPFSILLFKYQNYEEPGKVKCIIPVSDVDDGFEFSAVVTEAFNGNPAHPGEQFPSVLALQTSYLFHKAVSD